MSLPELRHPGYTVEDWKMWDGRWELINGVAYDMTPAPSTNHQEASSNLHAAIWNALAEAKQKPGVFIPDLLGVCDPAKFTPHGIEGLSDLVVKILSPSGTSRDRSHKRWAL